MACHVFSSSNHAYAQVDAGQISVRGSPGRMALAGFGRVHPQMSLAVFLDPYDGTNFPFQ